MAARQSNASSLSLPLHEQRSPIDLWRLSPLHTPRVWRRCRRCDRERPFASSDRFRVNANQRRIDVWLIYRCTDCDATWNREILARVAPRELGPERHARFRDNDRDAAWRWAFDLAGLAALHARVDADVAYRIDRRTTDGRPGCDRRIRLEIPYPCRVRLDKLLSRELGVSRSRLQGWCRGGILRVVASAVGDVRASLRKHARDGQEVLITARAWQESAAKTARPDDGALGRRA